MEGKRDKHGRRGGARKMEEGGRLRKRGKGEEGREKRREMKRRRRK